MNQRVAGRAYRAVEFFFLADFEKVLKLEALQLFSHGHQHKQIEGEGLSRGHLLGAVAQSGGQMQNHILKSLVLKCHRPLLAR